MTTFKYLSCALLGFIISFSSMAQTSYYDKEWKIVDKLMGKKQLPKSALAEVKKIYSRAKEENKDPELVRSVIYWVTLQQETREDNLAMGIAKLEKEITTGRQPAAAILNSILADLYLQYFQQHRYLLYGRTNTINFNKKDIATWSADDFTRMISKLYSLSLSNKEQLKKESLDQYSPVLIKGNTRNLRPTLYDLLAHRALDYFKRNESNGNNSAYTFELKDSTAFAPAKEFIKTSFTNPDTASLLYKALELYQELIAFHLNDKNAAALTDIDIERIEFVHDNAIIENKDELYKEALVNVINTVPAPSSFQASFLLANYFNGQGSEYDPLKDTTNRFQKVKAKDILEKIISDSAIKNEGWVNSYNLLREIEKEDFSFQLEKVNIPEQPFRALVKYKNIAGLSFRLIKADDNTLKSLQLNEGNYWNNLSTIGFFKSWRQSLPLTYDLQEHSVEIKLDGLPVGKYILLGSTDENFNPLNNVLGAGTFYVSNISFINKGNEFFILNRESGRPLENANVELYNSELNNSNRGKAKKPIEVYTSDKNGYFKLKARKELNEQDRINVHFNNDSLFLDEPAFTFYTSNYQKTESKPRIFFFTDRSIYRPGQTVYFKGIAIDEKKDLKNIKADYTAIIYLKNANEESIDSIKLTTNDFGSFTGRFQLPAGGLNGEYSISDAGDNNVSISVEEYKRPTFHVDFDTLKQTYKVNDQIIITGKAKAYAGNSINGSKVSYRIVRKPGLIYSSYVWGWRPDFRTIEIAHGITTTDKEGNFALHFKAVPDEKMDKKLNPVFDYTVYTDVTDLGGETSSAEKHVTLAYQSMILKVTIPERLPVDSFKNLSIRTENMNEEFAPAKVSISIKELIPENRLIRKRYWQQPDQFIMNKEEYVSYFPHDEYSNETDFKTWPVKHIVLTENDSTRSNGIFTLSNRDQRSGFYMIEVTTHDADGQEIKDIHYVELFDTKAKGLLRPAYLSASFSDDAVQPGESVTNSIGTSSNVFLIREVNKANDTTGIISFSTLNNEIRNFIYNVTAEDRGGFGTNYYFVKDNRFYQFNVIIQVPWSDKELKVDYVTFRDKTLPGSKEEWKIKISGYKKDKKAAEALISMYDASLDQFREHSWQRPDIWPTFTGDQWNSMFNFSVSEMQLSYLETKLRFFNKIYDELITIPNNTVRYALRGSVAGVSINESSNVPSEKAEMAKFTPPILKIEESDSAAVSAALPQQRKPVVNNPIAIRKNFNETAFFFPGLRTNENGDITFSFTVPEALTSWKIQTFAHTRDLAFGLSEKQMITQKKLMVQPNMPRFVRQGDHIEFTAKIVNLSDSELTGQAQLELFDPETIQSVDGWFLNTFPNQYFTVAAGQSDVVRFPLEVPFQYKRPLQWRIVASTKNLSDGEQNILPVLSNKVLVTESMPLQMNGPGTKLFDFKKLKESDNSETLMSQSLTVEYTSNPSWYVVQALPYLMEYPYECAEQTWNRFYGNSVATMITNSSPRIRNIFSKWQTIDTSALLSNLEKNPELKTALLEETPWVMAAKSEQQQKRNIGLLFDFVKMNTALNTSLDQLKNMQLDNGSFPWFKGGPEDRYITQYIVTGIGHLKKLNAITERQKETVNTILKSAIGYLDKKLTDDYNYETRNKSYSGKTIINYNEVQYLYMRSFFPEYGIEKRIQTAYNFYLKQAKTNWMGQNKYMQGMVAISAFRSGDKNTALAILRSLKETSITDNELGTYWKEVNFGKGWYWWNAPVETESLMIEAYTEIANDTKMTNGIKTWLLKNKQTNNWQTTKATAEACYAFLMKGTNWLEEDQNVKIQLGQMSIGSNTEKTEQGTGYFKKIIEQQSIKPEMGNISVTVKPASGNENKELKSSISWGAVYWQYFENLDKITSAATPLKLTKKLFIESNTDKGPVLSLVMEGTELHIGDKIKVRIEISVNRDMEYVHMKDMRAAALEPVAVLSGYQWQGGLAYYQSMNDASANFFFNYLPKGTYVFEYPVFVTHTGNFSNGITTIQCMYAPEFNAHSEGIRISVENH